MQGTTVFTGSQTSAASGFVAILPNMDSTTLYNSLTMTNNNTTILYPARTNDAASSNWNTQSSVAGTPVSTGLTTSRPKAFACPSDYSQST